VPADEQLSEALLIYLGARRLSWPGRDDGAVTEAYGEEAPRLIASCVAILNEFHSIPVDWASGSEDDVTRRVLSTITAAHPELTEQAVNGLWWEFSYSWK
jgi:hypothetical protein